MAKLRPETIEFADSAPVIAEGSAEVQGTPAEVWAVLTDNERWPDWFGGPLCKVTTTSAQKTGLGSTRNVYLRPEKLMCFEEEFIAWDENERWAFTVLKSPPGLAALVERCLIEPIDETRTRVTYRMAFEPKGLMKFTAGPMRKQLGKAITGGMKGLAAEVVKRRSA